VHAHFFSRAYVDLLERTGCDDRILLDSRRAVFDVPDHGSVRGSPSWMPSRVERQILSMSAATPYLDDRARAVRAARFLNDEHAVVCRRYPDRFGFFATLPMPHIDAALDEIRRPSTNSAPWGHVHDKHQRALARRSRVCRRVRRVGPPQRSCSCIRPVLRASLRSSAKAA